MEDQYVVISVKVISGKKFTRQRIIEAIEARDNEQRRIDA